MSSMQEVEINRYHDEILHDVKSLVEKYRRAMDWDIPENDDNVSDKIIFQALRKALDQVESELA